MTRLIAAALLALVATLAQAADAPLVVGSKRFTESYVLGKRVVAGLAVNDSQPMLAGTLLALLQWIFDVGERWLRRGVV